MRMLENIGHAMMHEAGMKAARPYLNMMDYDSACFAYREAVAGRFGESLWRPISEYDGKMAHVLTCHDTKLWVRFGWIPPGHGSRWYYSGTSERSQYAETRSDDVPTHFQSIPPMTCRRISSPSHR